MRRRLLGWELFGTLVCACGLLLLRAVAVKHGNHALYDFRGGLYNGGLAILHGRSPYQPGFLAHQVAIMKAGGIARGETADTAFSIPVYPAAANVTVVPLSLLPFAVAGVLYTIASLAAMIGGIRLLGVRDWRCLALVLISWPFLYGLYLGAVGPFLVLGAGIAWRFRHRAWPPALAIAVIVAVKVFPWPLGIWLLITRRWRTLTIAIAAGVALTLVAWAAIGFDGLLQYPKLLSEISFLQEGRSASMAAVLLVAGVPAALAGAAVFALAIAILIVAWRLARTPGGEGKAFGLVIIAALTATPIVWDHYMVLLFVPVALASPRLSSAWLLPLCAPLAVVVSAAIIPVSQRLAAHPPETLRSALPWLVIEAAVTTRVLLGGLHLSILSGLHRRPHPHPSRPAPAAGSAELM